LRRVILLAALLQLLPALAAEPRAAPSEVVFRNVRVFDGRSTALTGPTTVLVRGNTIAAIGAGASAAGPQATVIDGGGRTLMPGLIDAHVHIAFQTVPQTDVLLGDIGYVYLAAGKGATDMLMRGFTSARDLGGPTFGIKKAIDRGVVAGPRLWPSGAFISQSGGHGDFRLPTELPAPPGYFSYGERVGAAAIADSPDEVSRRVREQLALGASQIKLMAGGGACSGELGHVRYRPRLHATGCAPGDRRRREVHRSRPAARRRHREAHGREGHLVEPATVY
jgi:imidazolonepropionase-like amidohydrolase